MGGAGWFAAWYLISPSTQKRSLAHPGCQGKRGGGVELNVGMIEKRKEPRKNISDDEIIWFVSLFPSSITLLVWSIWRGSGAFSSRWKRYSCWEDAWLPGIYNQHIDILNILSNLLDCKSFDWNWLKMRKCHSLVADETYVKRGRPLKKGQAAKFGITF